MAVVPSSEPSQLRVGDTWRWRRDDLADYPASAGWTLTYYFRNASAHFNVVAAADGDAYAVAVAMATTATRAAGAYDWYAFVANGVERHQVGAGRCEVLADVSVAAAFDGRIWARRMLDAVEAALEGRASADQLDLINTQLGDRSLTRDRAGLITLRSQLAAEARREESANAGRNSRLLVRFS